MKIALGVAALALIVLFFLNLDGAADVRSLEARIDSLQVANAQLRGVRIPRTDTVYRTQRDTLRVTRTRTDSILTTDTLWRVERVREILGSERAACDSVIAVCEVRVAQRDSVIWRTDTILALKDSVIALERKPCNYGILRGACPSISVFGGITATGHPVAGLGLSLPIKRLRF